MKYVYPFDEARFESDFQEVDEKDAFEVVPVYIPDAGKLKSLLELEFSSCIQVRELSVPFANECKLELQIQPLPSSGPKCRRKVTIFFPTSDDETRNPPGQVNFEVIFEAAHMLEGGYKGDKMLVHHLLGPILAGLPTGYTSTDIGESVPFDGMRLQLLWCVAANSADLKEAILVELNAITLPTRAGFYSTAVGYVTEQTKMGEIEEAFQRVREQFPEGAECHTSIPMIEGDRAYISVLLPAPRN